MQFTVTGVFAGGVILSAGILPCLGLFSARTHFKRMRLATVGTAHIVPPLPNEEWVPLWGPFSFSSPVFARSAATKQSMDRVALLAMSTTN